jgi:hypothetical protein
VAVYAGHGDLQKACFERLTGVRSFQTSGWIDSDLSASYGSGWSNGDCESSIAVPFVVLVKSLPEFAGVTSRSALHSRC